MRILVTGGAGFIGSHLVELLVQEGHAVVVIDNLSIGKEKNLQSIKDKILFHKVDILSENLSVFFKNVDCVVHLAALADIVPSIENPETYLSVNVQGTIKVLESMRQNGVPRIIYAASSSCYGIPEIYPTPETAPISPEYPYALSKYLGELIVLHWMRVYGVRGMSLRFFNVFGPRARTKGSYGAVLGVFMGQLRSGLPLTIVGNGEQQRDFVYVKDVAEAILKAALSPKSHQIYNVGSSRPIKVQALANLISPIQTYIPKRPGEPDLTFADTTKINAELGWQPKYSFEQGIQESLKDTEAWADAPAWTVEAISQATATWFKNLS